MTTTTRLLTIGLAAAGVIGLAGCDGLLGALQPSSVQVSDGMVVYTNPPSHAEGEPLIIGELTWDAGHACWYTVGADGRMVIAMDIPEVSLDQGLPATRSSRFAHRRLFTD